MARSGAKNRRSATLPSPEEYAKFVGQIELADIWLHEARVLNRVGPGTPDRAEVHISSDATWSEEVNGFRAFHAFTVKLGDIQTPQAEVSVTFGLHFESDQPITEGLFEIFSDVNLPVNTWPYLREYIASAVGRMSWQPFTLPTLKRGTRIERQGSDPSPRRSTRRSKGTAKAST